MAPFIELFGAAAVGLASGVAGVVVARIKQPADLIGQSARMQEALGTQANAFISKLVEERRAVLEEMDRRDLAHRAEILSLRSDFERRHQQCEGENAQLRQTIESLVTSLRKNGLSVPDFRAARPFFLLADGTETLQIANAEAAE